MISRRAFALAALTFLTACKPRPIVRETRTAGGIGGPFSLIDQDGKPVTEAALKGKWSAIYFGYTFCPDVCPASLQALGEGLNKMGTKGDKVQTYLITVDPMRDTPAQLKTYLSSPVFPKNTIGLTGAPEQIAAVTKAYRVYFTKEGEGPDYTMAHQSIIYLMGPDGELARPLTHGLTPDEIAKQIADAMKKA